MSGTSRIRVLLAGPYPRPGGMTGTYGRILENLRSAPLFRDEIEFLPLRVTLPSDGNPIKRIGVDLLRGVSSLRRRPDVLHFIMQKYKSLYREFPILEMARLAGTRTVVDIRAGTLQKKLERKGYRMQNGMMARLLRSGDAVVLECRKDVGFVQERFGRDALYVPNAVLTSDYERIEPNPDPPAATGAIRLIHSGRYSEAKGTAVLLESMKTLSRMGVRAELHLTGQGTEPEILQMIETYVQAPPTGITVIDHGWDVPDLFALLASAHVFVLPTTWLGEGHPNAVTEAMMAGLGMILTDWRHREDIVPEQGALIVPRRDPAAVAEAVRRYVEEPDLLSEARRANRACVAERYLDRVCYPRFLDLYRRLAARS